MYPPLVGIVGGHGPATSAAFCTRLVGYAQKLRTDRAPSFVMDSVPISMEVAGRCIAGDDAATIELVDGACESLRRLARMGVRVAAVPCNTLHAYADRFTAPDVRFLHIGDALVDRLVRGGRRRVGFLASTMTVDSGFYFPMLATAGIDYLLPEEGAQEALSGHIGAYVANGRIDEAFTVLIARVFEEFRRAGADCIALACTDIAAMIDGSGVPAPVPIADSMDALAEACARESVAMV